MLRHRVGERKGFFESRREARRRWTLRKEGVAPSVTAPVASKVPNNAKQGSLHLARPGFASPKNPKTLKPYNPMTFKTAAVVASTSIGSNPAVLIALSGSFNPCPVIVAAITLPAGICPAFTQ